MFFTAKANNYTPKRVIKLLALAVFFSVFTNLAIIIGSLVSAIKGDFLLALIFLAMVCPFIVITLAINQERKRGYNYRVYITESISNLLHQSGVSFSEDTLHINKSRMFNSNNLPTPRKEKFLFFVTKDKKITSSYQLNMTSNELKLSFENEARFLYLFLTNIEEAKKSYQKEDTNYFILGMYYLLNSNYPDKQSRARICYENNITLWHTGLANEAQYPTEDLILIKQIPDEWLERILTVH